ncbi:hypothetical protein AJ80_00310 [Polytolypa hystricis UAMH7299]|uniref:Uncharacterized protein n=1 Tax=Polytolypa hystricis (strain UAMH7299) TaxID=1447883 RepID=A0A2B7YVE3_POLH7|nr:hypothetical protein AJ80_00310 [Polytolypa hystricis UAMH7299]
MAFNKILRKVPVGKIVKTGYFVEAVEASEDLVPPGTRISVKGKQRISTPIRVTTTLAFASTRKGTVKAFTSPLIRILRVTADPIRHKLEAM